MNIFNWIGNFSKRIMIEKRYPITPYQIKQHFDKEVIVEVMDESYDSCSVQEMMDLASTFPAAYMKYKEPTKINLFFRHLFRYREDVFDCNKYAFMFKVYINSVAGNMSIGIVHVYTGSGKHSLNFFIDKDNKFWYIEPQNGKLMKEGSYDVKNYRSYWVVY